MLRIAYASFVAPNRGVVVSIETGQRSRLTALHRGAEGHLSMDNSMHTDTHTDQGKASIINGIKEEGVPVKLEGSPNSAGLKNGPAIAGDYSSLQTLQAARMEDLPDELQHITTDILPLGQILSRLAQFSHAKLQQLILDLASKPLPELTANGNAKGNAVGGPNGSLINGANGTASKGSVNAASPAVDDTSPESLEKKTMILNTIQDLHSRWVKTLVIAEWARNADDVSKLIDIRTHLAEKLELYTTTFWDMIRVKQEMAFAKVPSPDLKTALEVLSTGSVHWMPDVCCAVAPSAWAAVCVVCALTPFPARVLAETSPDSRRRAGLAP